MKGLETLYIFDYGGPILVIVFDDGEVRIYKKFNDSNLVNGMAAVAGLLKRVQGTKFFTVSRYVGFFGRYFIGVGFINDIDYRVFVLGFLKRLISSLDDIHVSIVDLIVETTIKHLKRELKIEKVTMIE